MSQSAESPITAIARIDRKINAVLAELCRLECVQGLSAASWQRAWDKHPDLDARFRELGRQRGEAQRERDELADKARIRAARAERRAAHQANSLHRAIFGGAR